MKIEHVALWVKDLERIKDFYVKYFKCAASPKYFNTSKQFSSYFLSFGSGARIEVMSDPYVGEGKLQKTGLNHFAISLGSMEKVDSLTDELRGSGYQVADGPRKTGDGYYESVVLDPEGNRIELTV